MSDRAAREAVARMATDPSFREAVRRDDPEAMAGLDLTADERERLRTLSADDAGADPEVLGQRLSKSSILGGGLLSHLSGSEGHAASHETGASEATTGGSSEVHSMLNPAVHEGHSSAGDSGTPGDAAAGGSTVSKSVVGDWNINQSDRGGWSGGPMHDQEIDKSDSGSTSPAGMLGIYDHETSPAGMPAAEHSATQPVPSTEHSETAGYKGPYTDRTAETAGYKGPYTQPDPRVDAGGGEAGIPITGGPFRPEELPAQAGVGEAGSYTPEQHDAGSAPVPLTEHAAVPSTDNPAAVPMTWDVPLTEHAAVPSTDNPAAVPMTWDVPLTEHAAVPSTDPHTEVGRGEAGHPISDGPYKSEPLPSEVGRGEAGQGGPA